MRRRITTEEIVLAYQETGSVWLAGVRVGLSGQSIWERLRAVGYPLSGSKWTEEEVLALEQMSGDHTITQIASTLGRTYGGVACKLSEMGLSGRFSGNGRQKLPRGAGWDKEPTLQRLRAMDKFAGSLNQFCRANGIKLDPFVRAIQKHDPAWWAAYAETHSDLPEAICPNCGGTYYPMTKKQVTCSRRCTNHLRADAQYFGGKRKLAIGMSDGVCQLCLESKPSLAAHHMLGKENDQENDYLIALCAGCHKLVGELAGRSFVANSDGLERLLLLVLMRRSGLVSTLTDLWVHVDVDLMSDDPVGATLTVKEIEP